MSTPTTPQNPLEALQEKVETLITKLEFTSVGFMGYQQGYVNKEPEPYDVQECADDIMQLVQSYAKQYALGCLPEKMKGMEGILGELPLNDKSRGFNQAIETITKHINGMIDSLTNVFNKGDV